MSIGRAFRLWQRALPGGLDPLTQLEDILTRNSAISAVLPWCVSIRRLSFTAKSSRWSHSPSNSAAGWVGARFAIVTSVALRRCRASSVTRLLERCETFSTGVLPTSRSVERGHSAREGPSFQSIGPSSDQRFKVVHRATLHSYWPGRPVYERRCCLSRSSHRQVRCWSES